MANFGADRRRAFAIGGLVLLALVGLGLWPFTVRRSYTGETAALPEPGYTGPIGPHGLKIVTWEATATCPVLLGERDFRVRNAPGGSLLLPGAAGCDTGTTRPALVLAMAVTIVATMVATNRRAVARGTPPRRDLRG